MDRCAVIKGRAAEAEERSCSWVLASARRSTPAVFEVEDACGFVENEPVELRSDFSRVDFLDDFDFDFDLEERDFAIVGCSL